MNKTYFDHRADNWDTPKRIMYAEYAEKFIRDNCPPERYKKLLEIGTGTGILSLLLSSSYENIFASDNSTGMLEKVDEKIKSDKIQNVKPILIDIEKNQIEPESYDLIFSTMVMHHIMDTKSFLNHLYKSLHKNGRIVMIDLMKEDGNFHSDNESVQHYGFTREELEKKCSETGFVNINFKHLYSMERLQKDNTTKDYPIFVLSADKN